MNKARRASSSEGIGTQPESASNGNKATSILDTLFAIRARRSRVLGVQGLTGRCLPCWPVPGGVQCAVIRNLDGRQTCVQAREVSPRRC
jgi:hypothetical protein